jgi:hypothetical protein
VARLNVRDSCNWKSLGFGLVSGAAEWYNITNESFSPSSPTYKINFMLIGANMIPTVGLLWKLKSDFASLHHTRGIMLFVSERVGGRLNWSIGKRRLISRQVWNLLSDSAAI